MYGGGRARGKVDKGLTYPINPFFISYFHNDNNNIHFVEGSVTKHVISRPKIPNSSQSVRFTFSFSLSFLPFPLFHSLRSLPFFFSLCFLPFSYPSFSQATPLLLSPPLPCFLFLSASFIFLSLFIVNLYVFSPLYASFSSLGFLFLTMFFFVFLLFPFFLFLTASSFLFPSFILSSLSTPFLSPCVHPLSLLRSLRSLHAFPFSLPLSSSFPSFSQVPPLLSILLDSFLLLSFVLSGHYQYNSFQIRARYFPGTT